jgi:hypothetical protein
LADANGCASRLSAAQLAKHVFVGSIVPGAEDRRFVVERP